MNISPKVYLPVLISIAAAVALKLITGDDTYLVGILVGLAAGAGGAAAPPARDVTQAEVARISANRR
jgi:hypothetical protein